jgi:hypothetical protein
LPGLLQRDLKEFGDVVDLALVANARRGQRLFGTVAGDLFGRICFQRLDL